MENQMSLIQTSAVLVPRSIGKGEMVVGSYPDKDFTTAAARELETSLANYNISHDIKIYDHTKHSFFSQQRTPAEVDASNDAWQRMLFFIGEHLN
jgi:dienelactone hydrolase